MRRLFAGAVLGCTALLATAAPPAGAATATVSPNPAATPAVDGRVEAIASGGGSVFIGGSFSSVGGASRGRVAALDAGTAAVRSWSATVSGGDVSALAVSPDGGTLYLGGSFTAVNGQSRPGLAALAVSDAALSSWNPGVGNGSVSALAVSSSTVFAGGNFTTSGGTTIGRLAAISRSSGQGVTNFDPHPNSAVSALALVGSTLYVGGKFTAVDGQARSRVAAVTTGGALTSWQPRVAAPVTDLAVTTGRLYAALGGGPSTGNGVAALSTSGGSGPLWVRNGDGNAQTVTVLGGEVYVGGHFGQLVGQTRRHGAAFDASGNLLGWAPRFNSALGVWAMRAVGSTLWVGGDFTTVNGKSVPHLARFN